MVRYYDPAGLFSTDLPAANDMSVFAPQQTPEGTHILSGVISSPGQPAPAQGGGGFGGLSTPQPTGDQSVYLVWAVEAGTADTPESLSTTLPDFGPGVDVRLREAVQIGGHIAALVVADRARLGRTDASGFTVVGGVGYWIQVLLPPGEWEGRREDVLRLFRSFRPGSNPALPATQAGPPGLLIGSAIPWPVG